MTISYSRIEQLASGTYPITIKSILQYEGEAPMPAALDYYQEGDSDQGLTILIRKGSNVCKRKRTLQRILDGSTNPLASAQRPMKLVDVHGRKVQEILLEINSESVHFLQYLVKDSQKAMLQFLEGSSLLAVKGYGSNPLDLVRSILLKTLKTKAGLFLTLELQDQDRNLLFLLGEISALCLLFGKYLDLKESELTSLATAAFFHTLGHSIDANSAMGMPREYADQRLVKVVEMCRLIDIDPRATQILQNQHECLINKDDMSAKILQAVIFLANFHRSGVLLIEDQIEHIKKGQSFEASLSRLIQMSNEKVNFNCSEPILEESLISRLAALFKMSYLVDREREIRSQILKSCEYTQVLINRASVVCHHRNLDRVFIDSNEFCDGQGSDANIVQEGTKPLYIPKCNQGCSKLSQINHTHKH